MPGREINEEWIGKLVGSRLPPKAATASEQITPRLRKWGEIYEVDGEPLRKVVGRPSTDSLLQQLEQLNDSLRELSSTPLPSDARRVRKAVGKVG